MHSSNNAGPLARCIAPSTSPPPLKIIIERNNRKNLFYDKELHNQQSYVCIKTITSTSSFVKSAKTLHIFDEIFSLIIGKTELDENPFSKM